MCKCPAFNAEFKVCPLNPNTCVACGPCDSCKFKLDLTCNGCHMNANQTTDQQPIVPIIICLVGNSGVGKSTIARVIERDYNIPRLKSFTDRARRPDESFTESEQIFISKRAMDWLFEDNFDSFLAYRNNYGKARYCTLNEQLHYVNVYVVDEVAAFELKNNQKFKTIAIKLEPDVDMETFMQDNVPVERLQRDSELKYRPSSDYDAILNVSSHQAYTEERLYALLRQFVPNCKHIEPLQFI